MESHDAGSDTCISPDPAPPSKQIPTKPSRNSTPVEKDVSASPETPTVDSPFPPLPVPPPDTVVSQLTNTSAGLLLSSSPSPAPEHSPAPEYFLDPELSYPSLTPSPLQRKDESDPLVLDIEVDLLTKRVQDLEKAMMATQDEMLRRLSTLEDTVQLLMHPPPPSALSVTSCIHTPTQSQPALEISFSTHPPAPPPFTQPLPTQCQPALENSFSSHPPAPPSFIQPLPSQHQPALESSFSNYPPAPPPFTPPLLNTGTPMHNQPALVSYSPNQDPIPPPSTPPLPYNSTPTQNQLTPFSGSRNLAPKRPHSTCGTSISSASLETPTEPFPVKARCDLGKMLPSSEIDKTKLCPVNEVLAQYSNLIYSSKVRTLAAKLAKECFFGDEVLVRCTVAGSRSFPALPVTELNELKRTVFRQFPVYWNAPQEFEGVWKDCVDGIGQACKRLRHAK